MAAMYIEIIVCVGNHLRTEATHTHMMHLSINHNHCQVIVVMDPIKRAVYAAMSTSNQLVRAMRIILEVMTMLLLQCIGADDW